MIDFHSHILPELDDGSVSSDMTEEMLRMSVDVGVNAIVATPHFYPSSDNLARFLDAREASAERVRNTVPDDLPIKIYLGAEVAYFPCISRSDRLSSLAIKGTQYILIELPFGKWDEKIPYEILSLRERQGLTPILAHIDRYPISDMMLQRFVDNGVLIQTNAGAFEGFFSKRKALKRLKQQRIHLIGSDCHNTDSRKPNMALARDTIITKLGKDQLEAIDETGRWVLSSAESI